MPNYRRFTWLCVIGFAVIVLTFGGLRAWQDHEALQTAKDANARFAETQSRMLERQVEEQKARLKMEERLRQLERQTDATEIRHPNAP